MILIDGEGEKHRFERLLETMKFLISLPIDDERMAKLLNKVTKIQDHEGCLTVTSRVQLYQFEEACFALAWDHVGEEQIEFEVKADPK